MSSSTEQKDFTLQCRIEDVILTLCGVHMTSFSSTRSLTSIQQLMTLVFFAGEFECEVFGPASLGKTFEIISMSSDGKDQISEENQWRIVSFAQVAPDKDDPSRLLMQIYIESGILGFFPEFEH